MDLTDAVMLSGETSVGKYPIKAAQTIGRIARVTEEYLHQDEHARLTTTTKDELILTSAIARSIDQIVDDISAKLVAVWSQTGTTVRLLSKERLNVPVLALSANQRTCNQMSLLYGVIPRCQSIPEDNNKFTQIVDNFIINRKWVQVGDKIVLLTGQPIGTAGATNAVIVHTVGDSR